MEPGFEDGLNSLAKEILEYFLRNPQAADDLEGVARWRLLDQTVHRTLTQTKTALDQLVDSGFLRVIAAAGTDFVYELDPQKRDRAESLIKSMKKEP